MQKKKKKKKNYLYFFGEYSGYLVLSWVELGNKKYQKIPKKSTNFCKNPLCGSFTAAEMFP